jgi:hypothetical protein
MTWTWSKVTLAVDGGLLTLTAIGMSVLARQGYADGTGQFGRAFKGSPYILGLVGSFVMIGVVGIALIIAALGEPQRTWHILGILAHTALGVSDMAFLPLSRQLFESTSIVYVELVVHVLLIAAHLVGITRRQANE